MQLYIEQGAKQVRRGGAGGGQPPRQNIIEWMRMASGLGVALCNIPTYCMFVRACQQGQFQAWQIQIPF
jgi:hypothetical protein